MFLPWGSSLIPSKVFFFFQPFLGVLFGLLAALKLRAGSTPPPPLMLWGDAAPQQPPGSPPSQPTASAKAHGGGGVGGLEGGDAEKSPPDTQKGFDPEHLRLVLVGAFMSGFLKGLCGLGGEDHDLFFLKK